MSKDMLEPPKRHVDFSDQVSLLCLVLEYFTLKRMRTKTTTRTTAKKTTQNNPFPIISFGTISTPKIFTLPPYEISHKLILNLGKTSQCSNTT